MRKAGDVWVCGLELFFRAQRGGVLWVMCSQGSLRVGLAMSIAFGSWRRQGKF